MNGIRVSVGMPVYNSERFIAKALEGVLGQTFAGFELVISDNCSTDSSPAICEDYASRDSRIRFYRNERNLGAAANFNRVFELSLGSYFMWASSNDWYEPTFLEKAVAVLDARPDVVICCSRPRYFEGDPTNFQDVDDPMHLDMESPLDRFSALMERIRINNVMHGLIRADELRRTNLVDDYFSSDVVMVAELSLAGKFHQIDEPLYYRRMEESAATIMMNQEELRQFWSAGSRSRMRFQEWREQAAYWSMLARSRLGIGDRLRLARLLTKRLYWDVPKLIKDAREAFRP